MQNQTSPSNNSRGHRPGEVSKVLIAGERTHFALKVDGGSLPHTPWTRDPPAGFAKKT
jgi:hypothetical protein